jgi:hypothetical protein
MPAEGVELKRRIGFLLEAKSRMVSVATAHSKRVFDLYRSPMAFNNDAFPQSLIFYLGGRSSAADIYRELASQYRIAGDEEEADYYQLCLRRELLD